MAPPPCLQSTASVPSVPTPESLGLEGIAPSQYHLFWFSRSPYFSGSSFLQRHTQSHLFTFARRLLRAASLSSMLSLLHSLWSRRMTLSVEVEYNWNFALNSNRPQCFWLLEWTQKNLKLLHSFAGLQSVCFKKNSKISQDLLPIHMFIRIIFLSFLQYVRVFRFPYNMFLSCKPYL